jgi:hypothetical protein
MGCQGDASVGKCVPAASPSACLVDGVERCLAPGNVDECPNDRHVRQNGACYACGEPGTAGAKCKGGGSCDMTGNDAYECH